MKLLPPRLPAKPKAPPSARPAGRVDQIVALRDARVSLWKGPQIDGISYSKLCKFLCCMERFRLQMVEGLEEDRGWNHHMEYGSIWHEAEEAHAGGKPYEPALSAYYQKLLVKYPTNEKEITKWYLLAKMQFPIYVTYWRDHETTKGRKPIFEEKPFRFRYCIDRDTVTRDRDILRSHGSRAGDAQVSQPEGRSVTLRGKIDCAYERNRVIWLQENKTKGDIDQDGISQTVDQNLQTCIYHEALRSLLPEKDHRRIAGTMYNVIRRPLSDRFAPRQGKKESLQVFIKRVGDKIRTEPQRHFFRWLVPVSDRHLIRFRRECLHPILNHLCDWWDSIKDDPFHPEKGGRHYRFPFGVYHGMERGFRGDFFDLLTKGTRYNLKTVDDLFPEIH